MSTGASGSCAPPPPPLTIYASEAAALCNQHPYTPRQEACERLWERNRPTSYRAALLRFEKKHGRRVDDARRDARELLRQCGATQPALDLGRDAATAAPETPEQVRDTLLRASVAIDALPSMDERQRAMLRTVAREQIQTSYGRVGETAALQQVRLEGTLGTMQRSSDGCTVPVGVRDNNAHLYRRSLGELWIDACATTGSDLADAVARCVVAGRVDGFNESTQEVVEIKNRTRRFFDPLPSYELVQFRLYLALVGQQRGQLIERLGAAGMRTHELGQDADFLRDVVLVPLAQLLWWMLRPANGLLSDTSLQDAFLESADRGAFVSQNLLCA